MQMMFLYSRIHAHGSHSFISLILELCKKDKHEKVMSQQTSFLLYLANVSLNSANSFLKTGMDRLPAVMVT